MSIEIPQIVSPFFDSADSLSVAELHDPTAVGEGLKELELDAVALGSQQLSARRSLYQLGCSSLVFHSTSSPVRTSTTMKDGVAAFTVIGEQSGGSVNGIPLHPDQMLAVPPGVKLRFVVPAGYESIALLVSQSSDIRRPERLEFYRPARGQVRTFYQLCLKALIQVEQNPELWGQPAKKALVEEEIFQSLQGILSETRPVVLSAQHKTRVAYSQVVETAEKYVLEHTAEKVTLKELCQATGVSERTLQMAFKKLIGMSPIAYLQRLRLHQVRKSLRAAKGSSTTVARETLRWGFGHFGDFSRAYKDCFGELPSQTLRNASGDE